MKRAATSVAFAFLAAASACSGASVGMSVVPPPRSWEQDLVEHRRARNADFASDPDSPIPKAGRAAFSGLSYFPADPSWRYAGWITRYPQPEKLTIVTPAASRARASWGKLDVRGRRETQPSGLPARSSRAAGRRGLFLPFKDRTTERKRIPRDARRFPKGPTAARSSDFNRAYNPSRAREVPVPGDAGREHAFGRGGGGRARARARSGRRHSLSRFLAPDAPVFLVGFMGAGKSTVGRALAARWGWAFADTDAIVTSTDGRTIEEIFRQSGEGRFGELGGRSCSPEGRARRPPAAASSWGRPARIHAHPRIRVGSTLARPRARSPISVGPLWPSEDPPLRFFADARRRGLADLVDVPAGVLTSWRKPSTPRACIFVDLKKTIPSRLIPLSWRTVR